jgi:hypothetical protein
VSTSNNILAKKSEEGPLQYCKTGAESEGNNRLCPLVRCIIETATCLYHLLSDCD